jgi:hypothetical protein
VDNIKMDLEKEDVDFGLYSPARDRDHCEHGIEPSGFIKC